jgi:hypothetical protein
MSEEKSDVHPTVKVLDLHEEFIRHVEVGSSKMKTISVVSLVVAGLLSASYLYQILLPLVTGEKIVTTNLTDPVLVATELVILAITLAWFGVSLRELIFTERLAGQIRQIRQDERELMERTGLARE